MLLLIYIFIVIVCRILEQRYSQEVERLTNITAEYDAFRKAQHTHEAAASAKLNSLTRYCECCLLSSIY